MLKLHVRSVLALLLFASSAAAATADPSKEETWPGFRGHDQSGIAVSSSAPERWSKTAGIRWATEIPGRGWSSPIVWGDQIFVTAAVGRRPFKQPLPGLYGNDYIAELSASGLSGEKLMKKLRARDMESPEESEDLRYMVYALDARSGKIVWEREAHKAVPSGGRHRKNTYASETPFTDGQRLYVSFGQNVGLFCYTLDGTLVWKKQWPPQKIYLDFGTASSPVVHDGRVYLLHDSEQTSYITALDAASGEEIWRTERPSTGLPRSSWMTPLVWKNDLRTEIVSTGHGFVISYDLQGKELWRAGGMAMPTASPIAANGMLYVGTGSQGDANRPFLAVKPGASGDITLAGEATSNDFILWSHPRASGYTPSALAHDNRLYLVHDTGILLVLDAKTGKQIYKARLGGAGNTFSASPTAVGRRIYFLSEDGVTFVLDAADTYTELFRNDLGEMSLASPAVAGKAIYLRTEKKLYKIGGE
jgi:outer membrane protein assembly factor BamB